MSRKFAMQSFGCRVNLTEADSYRELLNEAGYEEVSFDAPADVVLVHTCTVTNAADSKSRQAMHRARRNNPGAILIVSGCYAQVSGSEILSTEQPDILIGTKDRHDLVQIIESFMRNPDKKISMVGDILKEKSYEELPTSKAQRTRAFIKIQEGCQQFCTYCIIPFARGPVRSRKPDDILRTVERLYLDGVKEIVFTGIHTGAYGTDLDGYGLGRLLREIISTGIERIRLGSLDPKEFDDSLKQVLYAGAPMMNHYHIALQSGSDTVLERMKRGYTTTQYRNLLKEIRSNIKDVTITTDVMVGFPGETEMQHKASMDFIEEMGFSDIHVFKYSPRKNTKAAMYPDQVDEKVKDRRLKEMLDLKQRLRLKHHSSEIGRKTKVLVEKTRRKDGGWLCAGYSENYQWTRFWETDKIEKNQIVAVAIESWDDQGLIAQRLKRR